MEKKKIIVVDDERDIRELIAEVMTGEGFDVSTASTGEEALFLIKENIYDVAIVDFNLPDMDGLTLHHKFKVMDKELANSTIFISGLIQSKDNLDYFFTQSAGFLPKPFRVKDLIFSIKKVIEQQ